MKGNRAALAQALRMTASALAAYGLALALGLPQGFWAVITAVIVTQGNIGGSLKAAVERLLGSVFGAVYGGLVVWLVPHQSHGMTAVALALAVAPLAIPAAKTPGFRVAPVTAIIVLLGSSGAAMGPLEFALDRTLEVALGCAVGIAVSLVVARASASGALLQAGAQVARLLARQLESLDAPDEIPAEAELQVAVRRAMVRLETLVGEAARERRSHLSAGPDPGPLLRTLMRLRHDTVMLRRMGRETDQSALRAHLDAPWHAALAAGAIEFNAIAAAFGGRGAPPPDAGLASAVAAYGVALDTMRRDAVTRSLPTDAVARLFSVSFLLDQFRRDIDDLRDRAVEFADPAG